MNLTPKNFHHHSPELHLAFICAAPHPKGSPKYQIVRVRAPSYEEGALMAATEFICARVPTHWVQQFMGHVV